MTKPTRQEVPMGPKMNGRERAAAATLWLPVVVIAVTAVAWWSVLPAELPRQWNGGEVISTSPTIVVLAVTGGAALLGAIFGLAMGAQSVAGVRRGVFLITGCAAGLAFGVWLVLAGIVVATGSPQPDADAWPLLGLLAGAYGLLPFTIAPRRNINSGPHRESNLSLGVNESAAWFGTVRVRLFALIAAVAAVAAITLAVFAFAGASSNAVVTSIVLALVAVASGAFAWLRVSVDQRGLRVVSGLFRFPLKRIRIDDIECARVTMIRPTEWGGFGYRVMPGRSAIVVAAGPGIAVQRRDGRLFAVTAPEPELPASLLTALAAR